MNDLSAFLRASLWWLTPLALLAAVIGWEIDWGAALRMRPAPDGTVAPKQVATGLLPDYEIAGGLEAYAETVNRTLFNPTRRPAPVALVEAAKPQMQKGRYTLTGTTVTGERSLAFLKETKGGKFRTVRQGETIDGMLVAEVKPDRVKLTLADDSEELVLKVATNPKPTPQPAAQAPKGAAAISPGMHPVPPGARPDVAQTLAERRRAARAAAAAAAAGGQPAQQPGAPAPAPARPAAQQQGAAGTPPGQGWAAVYQRYQQRRNR